MKWLSKLPTEPGGWGFTLFDGIYGISWNSWYKRYAINFNEAGPLLIPSFFLAFHPRGEDVFLRASHYSRQSVEEGIDYTPETLPTFNWYFRLWHFRFSGVSKLGLMFQWKNRNPKIV